MTSSRVSPIAIQRFARRGESEWRRLIERQRASGLSQAAFCERESVCCFPRNPGIGFASDFGRRGTVFPGLQPMPVSSEKESSQQRIVVASSDERARP